MLLTISGPPGAGTSTVAKAAAQALDLEHISGGDIFREAAAERDLSLEAFNELAEDDPEIDLDLDQRLRQLAIDREDLVLESRLAGWLAGDNADLRVWLDAPIAVRADRIADREATTPSAAEAETRQREASEGSRYAEYYGIDIAELSIYDLVLNTARWDADGVVDLVVQAAESYDPNRDEGAFPIENVVYPFADA